MINSTYIKALGENLRKIREERNLSQAALCEETGISIRTIRRIENGALPASIDKIFSIIIALEVQPEEVFPKIEPIK